MVSTPEASEGAMKTTLEFIADVKSKYSIESDYAAAKLLGVSKMTMSHYRNGKGLLGDDSAIRVAELLGLDTGYVLACIASERARKPEVKAAWKHTAEMLYGLAAALAVVAFLPTVNLSGDQFNIAFAGLAGADAIKGTLYIM